MKNRKKTVTILIISVVVVSLPPSALSFQNINPYVQQQYQQQQQHQQQQQQQHCSSNKNTRRPIRNGPLHSHDSSSVDSPPTQYNDDAPYLEAAYDPALASTFFRARPLASLARLTRLLTKSSTFLLSTLLDSTLHRQDEDRIITRRSAQLIRLITDLGPAFIKVGQALSARTDLLPPRYAKPLEELQDAVPPFDAKLGRAVIERELGIDIDEVFSYLSPEPVASASIGQVYRGTIRATGEEVAVKVQRPNVLRDVALDLFLVRGLAPFWERTREGNTDIVGLVDAWGEGFVNELDYGKEAEATKAFSKAMKERGLGSVFAPEVVEGLSSKHVLTTGWVDGERLATSEEEDVPRLCGVALNAYLTMLLDTGSLHCDPHPGNLLRTPDGRLCILDWGMVIDVPTDLQLSLLEFIADLNAENYEEVPNDLVKLSFVPEGKLDELRESGLTVAISNMLKLAGEGGGPKGAMKRMVAQNKEKYSEALAEFDDLDSPEATKVRQALFKEDWKKQMAEDAMSRGDDVDAPASTTMDLTTKIDEMQRQNADVFAIPDYFVYMSRAFSTLEGIGLSSDSNYSILNECFPYLAKRLLSDDSPRARGALRTLLYGTGDELDLSKLRDLSTGLESYTTSTRSVESGRGDDSGEGREVAVEQLVGVVLSEEGNYVQELVLREAAVALDATVRDVVWGSAEFLKNVPSIRSQMGEGLGRLFPFPLPLELARAVMEVDGVDERDERRLENVQILRRLVSSGGDGSGNGLTERGGDGNPGDAIGKIAREAAARRTALGRIGVRFGGEVVSVQAERLRQRVEEGRRQRHDGNDKGMAVSGMSELAERMAVARAERLERLASAILSLDGGGTGKDSGGNTDLARR